MLPGNPRAAEMSLTCVERRALSRVTPVQPRRFLHGRFPRNRQISWNSSQGLFSPLVRKEKSPWVT